MAERLAQLPSPFMSDPEHWLALAAEMRTIASTIAEDGIRASMLRLATDYDKLAARAIARAGREGLKARPAA
jgi:hypothetical protein